MDIITTLYYFGFVMIVCSLQSYIYKNNT